MLIHWIWFSLVPQLQSQQKLVLLERFRDPEEIFYTNPEVLAQTELLTEAAISALEDKDLTRAQQILQQCAQRNIRILTFRDSAYPSRLKNISDPPMVLYCQGSLPDWDAVPVIGTVGTRKASAYGLYMAAMLGGQISGCGAFVASGGAEGIDAASMTGALAAGGKVICVLAGGLDQLFPKSNRGLFARVLENGCLISEYPPGTPSFRWNFPARNRIISGISNGVLVVEAPKVSGALITAAQAMDQGRDVFVVPANADVESSAGSNQLLRQHAIPVWDGWDIVGEYEMLYPGKLKRHKNTQHSGEKVAQTPILPEKEEKVSVSVTKKTIDNGNNSSYSDLSDRIARLEPEEKTVLACLTEASKPVDVVIEEAQLPAGRVLSILTKLTLKGLVRNHPGKCVSLSLQVHSGQGRQT